MKTANTYQLTAELLEKGNKSEIYNLLYMNSNMVGGVAETIAMFLRDCSTTFVSDIASKYGKVSISEKQAWCMTFEAVKINHMFAAWVEKEERILADYLAIHPEEKI